MYELIISPEAQQEIRLIRTFDQRRILLDLEKLRHEPTKTSKNKKRLADDGLSELPAGVRPGSLWELRSGAYRVFYTVDERGRVVVVSAVRHKGRKMTRDIL